MSDLTLEERVTRLEELFKLHWGSLDIEDQKKSLKELNQGIDEVKKRIDETSRKWDEYQESEAHQDFLNLHRERSRITHETRSQEEKP